MGLGGYLICVDNPVHHRGCLIRVYTGVMVLKKNKKGLYLVTVKSSYKRTYSGREFLVGILEGTFIAWNFSPAKGVGIPLFVIVFPVIPKLISAGALHSVMPLDQGFPQYKQPLGYA